MSVRKPPIVLLILGIGLGLLQATVSASRNELSPGEFCTTTTKCTVGSKLLGPAGKKGRTGEKGEKGEKGEACVSGGEGGKGCVELVDLARENEKLRKSFKNFKELVFSFPAQCSDYIERETAGEVYDAAPIYPGKSEGSFAPVIANCTKLPVYEGNIRLPFEMVIPKNSIQGRTLVIKATPLNQPPHQFVLDFRGETDEGLGKQIYFHMNPRFILRSLIANSFDNGWWLEEEKDAPFLFRYGTEFIWKITVDERGYHVQQDGRFLLTYTHKLRPLDLAHDIVLNGSLQLNYVSYN